MAYEKMHPACKDFNENLKYGSDTILLQCNIHQVEEDCLHEHIKNVVMNTECVQRQALVDEIATMFPQYSKQDISSKIDQIPLYINARYAILNALLNKWTGCHCPSFTLDPLQAIVGKNLFNKQNYVDLTLNQPGRSDEYNNQNLLYRPSTNISMSDPGNIDIGVFDSIYDIPAEIEDNIDNNSVQKECNQTVETNCIDAKKDINNSGDFKMQSVQEENVKGSDNGVKKNEMDDVLKKVSSSICNLECVLKPGTSGYNNLRPVNYDNHGLFEPQPSTSNTGYSAQDNENACDYAIDITNDDVPEAGNEVEIVDRELINLSLPKNKRKMSIHPHPIKSKSHRLSLDENNTVVIKDNVPLLMPPPRNDEPLITIGDEVNPILTRKLVNTLSEIFPDCELTYLENICQNNIFTPATVEMFTEKLLGEVYPRRVEERDLIDYDLQLDIMMGVLPDADPGFLSSELNKMTTNDELKLFMSDALETRTYPKSADAARIRQMHAQTRQYTEDFNPEEFLNIIPDPETYFTDKNFKAGIVDRRSPTYHYMSMFLKNHFNKIGVKQIQRVLNYSPTLLDAVNVLRTTKEGILISKRKKVPTTAYSHNIPLLQLFAYIEYIDVIHQVKEDKIRVAAERKLEAIANNEVNTCCCCFDDEVMPEDTFSCSNGCSACKKCIKRSVEILFAENNLNFPCLADCGAHFSLDILQACLTPKVFCKIAKRKQLDEVKAAGIEDLEICPFCDFAAIPAPEDKIFKCFNPDCMKESCRECKEPSHIPLRCDELEKDVDVKQRTYVENQMTEALMRKCWKCGLKFIKADGCNKIKCQCGATMCYICNAANVDYNHFNGQGGNIPDRCPLYSNTALLHEKDAIKGGEQAKVALGITSLKVDPLADAEVRIKQALKEYKPLPGAHN